MRTINITVDKDGNITVDAVGFKGKGCAEATKAIEQALGKTKSKTNKPEYNADVQRTQTT